MNSDHESAASPAPDRPPVEVIEIACNVDDVTGEVLGDAMERLLAAGALDVWATPIVMKKSRPAYTVSVLARAEEADGLGTQLLALTGSFGLRFREWGRVVLERDWKTVATAYGEVRVKVGRLHGQVISQKVEYESAKALADQSGVPVRVVLDAARAGMIEKG